MSRIVLTLAGFSLILAGCSDGAPPDESVLRVAVTTSTRDSGLLEVLVPVFEEEHAARVDIIATGTGAALKLGRNGDVDAVLVHARAAEDAFMAAGHGIRREDVMYNSFQILGPRNDPAQVSELKATDALQQIGRGGHAFVSRGDDSGTHTREVWLWKNGGGRAQWDAYLESGQGMGATLIVADQKQAYVLCDRGTFLKMREKISLIPLVTSDENLYNPYGILTVNPAKHPAVEGQLAEAFADFVISPRAQRLIRDYRIAGEPLFFPLRLSEPE